MNLHLVDKRFRRSRPARAGAVSLDEQFDAEIWKALKRAVDAASPERRLLLLTIAEHPQFDKRIERMIDAAGEALR